MERAYIAIDLKSFYASVECMERGLDPLKTNLVVADEGRTEKTICLAVSPSLKAYGIPGRTRLYDAIEKAEAINAIRRNKNGGREFRAPSYNADELASDPSYELAYIIAPPRMDRYMQVSTQIFGIYRSFIAAEDIHVYSVDEVFIDATNYLNMYHMTAHELAMKLVREVLKATGITATAGVGTNMYLCKIAMDIVAKHQQADADGVRIADLDEMSYRRELWEHRPLTDFWRIGKGIAKRLETHGMYTMGDVARMSLNNEELLYRLFGINAELIIDHAWGWENCTIADVHSCVPQTKSVSIGQVLPCPYDSEKGRLIVREMTDQLSLRLIRNGLTTDRVILSIGYDVVNLKAADAVREYQVAKDYYGRNVPKGVHGMEKLPLRTASAKLMTEAMLNIFDQIIDKKLYMRRAYVVADNVLDAEQPKTETDAAQLDIFTDLNAEERRKRLLEKEKRRQEVIVEIKERFGKNAILKGMNFEEGGTTIERNAQVGGHKA